MKNQNIIKKLKEGNTLIGEQGYAKSGKKYVVKYTLFKNTKKNAAYSCTLLIEETQMGFKKGKACSERNAKIEFVSYEKALEYLKKKEGVTVKEK